jgi:uncharacterized delta-60 repeat protein
MNTNPNLRTRAWIQLKDLLPSLVLALSIHQSPGAPGDVDLSFDPGSSVNGEVRAIALQSDGRFLIGGGFTTTNGVPQRGIVRLNADGSLDGSFAGTFFEHAPDYWNPFVYSIAVQAGGKIVVGGQFTSVNGIARTNIARLNADGSLDPSFLSGAVFPDGNGNSIIQCVALQKDAQILIAGCFSSVNGVERNNIARLNGDGSLDSTFNASLGPIGGGGGPIAIQSDGKILIAGNFSSVNGVERHNIARLNADGSLDTSFLNGLDGVNNWVLAVVLQPDGKILIGSQFSLVNGIARHNIARLNTDGSLDNSFLHGLAGTDYGISCLALQNDSKVLIGGWFGSVNGAMRNQLARLNPDGSLDTTFLNGQAGPNGDISSLALQPDGKILLGGSFTSVNGAPRSCVARLTGAYAAPILISGPTSRTAEIGSTASFSVRAAGSPVPTCQWFFNGNVPVGPATTNCILHLSSVQPTQAGDYTVVITNAAGAVTSAPAMLNVIAAVERRPIPGVKVTGESASLCSVDYADSLSPAPNWTTLGSVSLTSTPQYCFDLTLPLPPQRFYRAWQTGTPGVRSFLDLHLVPAITLTGSSGHSVRLDYINQFGPIDAWVTLATVPLTNTSQLYFDILAPGQPPRLYRLVPSP